MQFIRLVVWIFSLLVLIAQANSIEQALLSAMENYERTGLGEEAIRNIIEAGCPLVGWNPQRKTLIEHLATNRLLPVPGALDRRLAMIQMAIDVWGCELKFNIFSLVYCVHERILKLLLSRGVDGFDPTDFYRALATENLEFAELFLHFGPTKAKITHDEITYLYLNCEEPVWEWIQSHLNDIQIIM